MAVYKKPRIELTSRRSPERTATFEPEDYPELWGLTKGDRGLSGLRQARSSDVYKLFLPRPIRDELPLRKTDPHHLQLPEGATGRFELMIGSDDYELALEAYVERPQGQAPAMLCVSDYEAHLPTERGSQAFYANLGYQLDHMNIPVIFGQKVPPSLGYFIHRVGQVPVALLDDRFQVIRDRIQELQHKSQADMLAEFPAFAYTVQIAGHTPAELVKAEYQPALAELQQQFDQMSKIDRRYRYPQAVAATFHLTGL